MFVLSVTTTLHERAAQINDVFALSGNRVAQRADRNQPHAAGLD
jgi:hypothetical protein